MKKDVYIGVSKHAKERILERISVDRFIREYAEKAFNTGKQLNEEEAKKMFEKGADPTKKGYWGREYRKFKGFLFVFSMRSETKNVITYTLLTVVPL